MRMAAIATIGGPSGPSLTLGMLQVSVLGVCIGEGGSDSIESHGTVQSNSGY